MPRHHRMVGERRGHSGPGVRQDRPRAGPQASFTILPGVGHDPMIDDPDLVARTILAVTGAG